MPKRKFSATQVAKAYAYGRKKAKREYGKAIRRGALRRYKGMSIQKGKRRKSLKVRVSAPSTMVLQTFYSNKILPRMKRLARAFKMQSRNLLLKGPIGRQVGCNTGEQEYATIPLFTTTELRSWADTIGMAPAGTTGDIRDTNRLFWRNAEMDLVMTNQSNNVMFLELYHYTCRRDCGSSPGTLWYSGMEDEDNGATTYDLTNIYGSRPGYSGAVAQFWKLKKVYSVVLHAGQVHRHVWRKNLYRIIDNQLIAQDNQNRDNLAGITECIMFVVRGSPGANTSDYNLVNTTATKLNIAYTIKANVTYVADNDFNLKYQTGTGMGIPGTSTTVINVNANQANAPNSVLAATV